MPQKANALIHESSPYLLQHAYNPVQWEPWSEEAFERAKIENKLVLISIGYAACHWCHVMEKECFEDKRIAAYMNAHFVCIKVDREERPDIDNIYMQAVRIIQSHGGWPLNCFSLPNGKPIYGGSYFPPQKWLYILQELHKNYEQTPERFYRYADQISQGVQEALGIIPNLEIPEPFSTQMIERLFQNIASNFDTTNGGFGKTPKFPLPTALSFTLWYAHIFQDKTAEQFTHLSLTNMAKGGIYDHLGGGFARYTVDKAWKIPHFEKMLYDNAQLVTLYSTAYKMNHHPIYKYVVEHTIAFIKYEMTDENGLFYAAFDADSEGEEGKYYVWTQAEVMEALCEEKGAVFCQTFGIQEEGNWEDAKNILQLTNSSLLENTQLKDSITLLLKHRDKRKKPNLDYKIITAWNAMMISALTNAYTAFGNEDYKNAAVQAADYIWTNLVNDDGKVYRTYTKGSAKIDAFLEDYAQLIAAYIQLYQVSFEQRFLEYAQQLLKYVKAHFWNATYGMFNYNSKDTNTLIASQIDIQDNVMPSSNSAMAHNLYDLGRLLNNDDYVHTSQAMLETIYDKLEVSGIYMAHWYQLMLKFCTAHQEVVIMGDDCKEKNAILQHKAHFNTIFAGSQQAAYLPLMQHKEKGQRESNIYICTNKNCALPTNSLSDAEKQLNINKQ